MFLFRFHITKIQPGSIYYPLRLFQAASTQSNVKVFLFLSKCTFARTSTIKVVVVVVKKKDSEIKHLNQTLTNWVIIWNIRDFTRAAVLFLSILNDPFPSSNFIFVRTAILNFVTVLCLERRPVFMKLPSCQQYFSF